MHVDEFIDRYTPLCTFASTEEREAERYARFVLSLLRFEAALVHDFEKFIPPLFCTHEGKRWRVVHSSHLGYVGLNRNLAGVAVDERADPSECSGWGAKP